MITTDNNMTLINALAEIERLKAERDQYQSDALMMTAERDALKAANRDLQDWYDAAIGDARRYQWALPILSGDDDSTANKRAITLGILLAQGLTGHDAIDLAMKGEQS